MTSHPKIVVGIDGSPRGDDALAFARVLADVLGTGLLLTCIYGPGGKRAHARELLDARRSSVTDSTVEATAYADSSPARGLARVAAARSAEIIVVGPSHRAGIGLVVLGSTAQQLVHETPRAVAVAPRSWRPHGSRPLLRIGCGYDGSHQSEAALATAAGLTRLVGGELEIVRAAWSRSLAGPLGIAVLADLEAHAEAGLRDAADALPQDLLTHGNAVLEHPADALVSRSRELDVLVVGSRGKGALNAAVTGSVSTRILRDTACPVIVVPGSAPALVGAYVSGSTRPSSGTY